ncbi:MAG TPA: DNA polymerase III subunit beta [Aquihabitans sp.]|jgi:DNA polymerase-3 subunit beta|nr:DNA polymerase III subunit beta [Aquihabitans sp.]
MKATAPTTELRRIVGVAARAAGKGIARPVLGGAHLHLDDDGNLTATGTDIDLTMSARTTVDGGDPGAVVIPAARLAAVLGKIKADEIALATEDDEAIITAGRTTVRLRCLPLEEWPRIAEPDGEPADLDAEVWDRIARVAIAASADVNRPTIQAVQFHDGQAAGTDSYRLHWTPIPDGLDALVPGRAITEARRLGDTVTMATGTNHATFTAEGGIVTTRLVDGSFPKWGALVPTTVASVTVDRDELLEAMGIAEVIHDDDAKAPIRLNITPDQVEVTKTGASVGQAATTIDATTDEVDTGGLVIGYNPTFLAQAVGVVAPDGGPVTIGFVDATKPSRLAGAGIETLVMPVRVT